VLHVVRLALLMLLKGTKASKTSVHFCLFASAAVRGQFLPSQTTKLLLLAAGPLCVCDRPDRRVKRDAAFRHTSASAEHRRSSSPAPGRCRRPCLRVIPAVAERPRTQNWAWEIGLIVALCRSLDLPAVASPHGIRKAFRFGRIQERGLKLLAYMRSDTFPQTVV